ncbi:MAG: porphobilinogen synthase [Candidatus Methylarchaceae archaeon HK02M1]|nr:porphobilinogen synthase [Candidatus Methylarchaceae archaeon HK01M]MCP8312542.1 porphobilinogen synthase [Candidatus Methylarchaceae archaeon HK02M1]
MGFPIIRPRRLRRTSALRNLICETRLNRSDLIYPIFIDERVQKPIPIESMPEYFRLPIRYVIKEVRQVIDLNIKALILFGIPSKKDEIGSQAFTTDGVIQRTVRVLKREFGDRIVIITDVCLCEYTNHGHCGVLKEGEVDNDSTLEILQKVAVSQAQAGADIVAPSAMMDGQVKAIREALDDSGFIHTGIMAYSAKYASSFYGPFREAAESKPEFGNRKSYQMGYENSNEALREVELDISEGADIVIIKPALPYLDLIHRVKEKFKVPVAAYNVSGEYAMVKAAAQKGWIDEKSAILEILTSIKRAGANLIITYFAKDAGQWLD